MHPDWFNGIEILQGRWQHGEKVGYCYPSGLEKTLCKWDIYVPLVAKGLILFHHLFPGLARGIFPSFCVYVFFASDVVSTVYSFILPSQSTL